MILKPGTCRILQLRGTMMHCRSGRTQRNPKPCETCGGSFILYPDQLYMCINGPPGPLWCHKWSGQTKCVVISGPVGLFMPKPLCVDGVYDKMEKWVYFLHPSKIMQLNVIPVNNL